jgi:tRNA threonylcarbamoyladenosine biosynthesis protein TsaB
MGREAPATTRLLLIDTCGDPAGVALSEGERVCAAETLPRQRASAEIVAAIERLLTAAGWRLAELQGIGVVHGPGSFTGVRTGLSVAKGLSEAAALPVFAVSRLAVLGQSGKEGFVALDAGRGEVYVRGLSDGLEFLCSDATLLEYAADSKVVIAEDSLRERLAELQPEVRPLEAGSALALVLDQLAGGGVDVALLDAHYLREESGIYKQVKL